MTRRARWLTVLTAIMMAAFLVPAAASGGSTRTYSVTVTNLTGGQPLTPPLVATHRPAVKLFKVGDEASEGLKEIAENGNLAPLMSALDSNRKVSDVVVAAGDPPPLLPGETITFEIEGGRDFGFISWASMLICSNDGFTGDRLRLPRRIGRTVASASFGYDAGTEINTERFRDIVPPCPALTGVASTVDGRGTSNPALAENGVITHHDGVSNEVRPNRLKASVHGWDTGLPVAVITVTRTG